MHETYIDYHFMVFKIYQTLHKIALISEQEYFFFTHTIL